MRMPTAQTTVFFKERKRMGPSRMIGFANGSSSQRTILPHLLEMCRAPWRLDEKSTRSGPTSSALESGNNWVVTEAEIG